MHVEIIETSPLEREVQVAVDAEAVDSECQKALGRLKGRVKVKGFRPGKVPRRELERRYGKSVRRDVMKTLIQTTLSSALGRDDLKRVLHVSPPEVVDDSGEGGFSYRFRAEVKPDVTPTGYLGILLGAPEEPVTAEDVEREVERLRKQHAIVEPIEDRDVVEAEDWVTISYRRLDDGPEAKPSDIGLDLTDDNVPPALRDAVIGMKVGDDKTVSLQAPQGSESGPSLPPVEVEVTVQGIKKRTLPDLDDELASMIGEFETLEALRTEIERQLGQQREQNRNAQLRRQLEDRLLQQADFDLPSAYMESRLDDEVRSRLQLFDDRMETNPALLAEVREGLRSDVERRVQLEFILGAIAEREKVSATEADIDRAVEELVRPAGAHAATLRQLYQKPTHRAGLRERIRLDKTLDFLLSKATISEEAPSGDQAAASEADPPQSAEPAEPPTATSDTHGEADGD